MTEEAKEQQITDALEKGSESTTQAASGERSYNQSDVDSIVAKVKAGLEGKLTKATETIDSLKTKAMSDDEKKIEQAVAEATARLTADHESYKRTATVARLLVSKGVPEEQVERVALLVSADGEPAEAVEALSKDMPNLFDTKRIGGGGGRNPDQDTPPELTPEYITEKLQGFGTIDEQKEWLDKNRIAIDSFRNKAYGLSKTIAPGQGLTFQKTEERK